MPAYKENRRNKVFLLFLWNSPDSKKTFSANRPGRPESKPPVVDFVPGFAIPNWDLAQANMYYRVIDPTGLRSTIFTDIFSPTVQYRLYVLTSSCTHDLEPIFRVSP